MQKLNFLPQVKVWNAIEFVSRNAWDVSTNHEVGMMTYDSSDNVFKVSLEEEKSHIAMWRTVLTGDGNSNEYVKRIVLHNSEDSDTTIMNNIVDLYTYGKYDSTNNRLATMSDVRGAISGSTILGVEMDNRSIVDNSIASLYSDPEHTYDASSNQLATLGTVKEAIGGLGTAVRLRQVYPNPYPVLSEQDRSIDDFSELLEYFDENPGGDETLHDGLGNWNVKKGDVVIFGNAEYIYTGVNPEGSGYDPTDMSHWELFGTLGADSGVISFGGKVGTILIDNHSFRMTDDTSTLILRAAGDASLGGIKTGYVDSSSVISNITHYQFGVDLDAQDRAFVSIPVQNGKVEAGLIDASTYISLISNNGAAKIYHSIIKPDTLHLTQEQYANVSRVAINHNLGTNDLIVNVYKNLDANAVSRSIVYVDEIISDSSVLRVDFGSARAFTECQEGAALGYYGYTVVFSASNTVQSFDPSNDTLHNESN